MTAGEHGSRERPGEGPDAGHREGQPVARRLEAVSVLPDQDEQDEARAQEEAVDPDREQRVADLVLVRDGVRPFGQLTPDADGAAPERDLHLAATDRWEPAEHDRCEGISHARDHEPRSRCDADEGRTDHRPAERGDHAGDGRDGVGRHELLFGHGARKGSALGREHEP